MASSNSGSMSQISSIKATNCETGPELASLLRSSGLAEVFSAECAGHFEQKKSLASWSRLRSNRCATRGIRINLSPQFAIPKKNTAPALISVLVGWGSVRTSTGGLTSMSAASAGRSVSASLLSVLWRTRA